MSGESENKLTIFLKDGRLEEKNTVIVDNKGNTASDAGIACKETGHSFTNEQANRLVYPVEDSPLFGSHVLADVNKALNPFHINPQPLSEGIAASNSMEIALRKVQESLKQNPNQHEVEVDLGNLPPPLTKMCEGLEKMYQGKS